eukprot:61196_1
MLVTLIVSAITCAFVFAADAAAGPPTVTSIQILRNTHDSTTIQYKAEINLHQHQLFNLQQHLDISALVTTVPGTQMIPFRNDDRWLIPHFDQHGECSLDNLTVDIEELIKILGASFTFSLRLQIRGDDGASIRAPPIEIRNGKVYNPSKNGKGNSVLFCTKNLMIGFVGFIIAICVGGAYFYKKKHPQMESTNSDSKVKSMVVESNIKKIMTFCTILDKSYRCLKTRFFNC